MADGGLINQLMRRKVPRVLGMYLVGSFVALQVGDVAFDPIGLPAWSMTALIGALALGLPIVAILAWIYDVTPQGVVRTPAGAQRNVRLTPLHIVELGLILGLSVALGYFVFQKINQPSHTDVVDRSITVMPFTSIGDGYQALADGLTAEITDSLAAIPDLRIATFTAMEGSGGVVSDAQIGKLLNVAHLLKGTVQSNGNTIRTQVQLVHAHDNKVLWSYQSDKTTGDLFEIQDNIAQNTAIFLKSTLYKEALAKKAVNRTDNPDAYEAYLLALHYRGSEWPKVIEHAERAVQLDAAFVPAYTLLAEVYMQRVGGSLPAAYAHSLARQRLETALSLDPENVQALKVSAHLERIDHNYAGAEALFRRVKALASQDSTRDLANLLFLVGRLDEALQEYQRSYEIEPMDQGFYAGALFANKDYGQAIAMAESMVEVGTQRWREGGAAQLAAWHAFLGDETQARYYVESALPTLTPRSHYAQGYFAYALARIGRQDEAMEIIQQLEKEQQNRYISPAALFWGYLGVRDLDRTFLWLNRVVDENVLIVTVGLKSSPVFDELRDDLRFVSALDRLGLLSETSL